MNFKLNISLIVVNNCILNNVKSDTYSSFFISSLNIIGFNVSKISVIPSDIRIITHEIIISNREYDITIIISNLSKGTIYEAIGKSFGQKLERNELLEYILKKNNISFSEDELLLPNCVNILAGNKYPLIQIQRFFLVHETFMDNIFYTIFKQYLIDYQKPTIFKKIANIYLNGKSGELDKLKYSHVKFDLSNSTANGIQLIYESNSFKDIIEFENDLKQLVLVSSTKAVMHESVYSDVNILVKNALQVIETCFLKYGPENTFICFNGGKDCTVLLHLTMVVLEKHYPCYSRKPICLYVQGPQPFAEQEEFVNECQHFYSLDVVRLQMDIKSALKIILGNNPTLKACLMGTRRTDPFSQNLSDFQVTDSDYPEVMRVSPLLNWTYFNIWNYLLYYKIPYCKLYDLGYTSLGNVDNTLRNSFLLYKDIVDGQEKYLPAYKLLQVDSERSGRNRATNLGMAKYGKQFPLTGKVLQQLITTENSCVEVENSKKHITLFPYHLKNINASVKEILDEDIARFNKDLDGILLGYKNIKLLTNLGLINTDSCFIHLDIQADFVIFKPVPEKELPAIVTKKSRDHVGCLVYQTFNVSLPKPEDIENWTGNDVEIGQEIIVKVTFANLDAKLPYIKAEFLNNISEYTNSIYKKPVNKIIKFDEELEEEIEPKVKEKKKKKKRVKEEAEITYDDIETQVEIKSSISKKRKMACNSNEDSLTELSITKKKRVILDEQDSGFDTEVFRKSMKKKKKHLLAKEENQPIEIHPKNDSSKKKKHSKVQE